MKNILKKKLFIKSIFIVFVVIFLDLYTKNIVFYHLFNHKDFNYLHYPYIKITNFFNLVYVSNNGISFGMFNDIKNAREIFILLQGSIAFALLFWLWKSKEKYISYSLSLIIGGAFGNVVDRIINGGVTDFLDFYINSYHWPAFNLADSMIFIGVSVIIFDEFFIKKNQKHS